MNLQSVDFGVAPIAGALFDLGHVLASPESLTQIERTNRNVREILASHCNGEYGDSDMSQVFENQAALDLDGEISSVFYLDEDDDENDELTLYVWTNPGRTETRMMMRTELAG